MKRGPKPSDVTPEESAHVRAALVYLRTRSGGWAQIAKVLGFRSKHLCEVGGGKAGASAALVFRIARLAQVGVDDVLTGRYPAANACPHCGHVPTPEVTGAA